MSLFAMQLANAFSSRELSNSRSLLKNSIHKLSSGKRLVKSRDDAGMLSVQMKMNADSYRNASAMGKIGNAVSFLDMKDACIAPVHHHDGAASADDVSAYDSMGS